MRKLNAPGDSVQDVFSTCIESYRDAALKNRLRSIVPVLSDEASRFEDCVLTSKTHTIPTADNVGGVVSKAEMLDIYESKFVKGTGRPYYDKYMSLPTNGKCPFCGIGTVSTLDHYLPKSKYPALATTPKNMIPVGTVIWERKGHFLLRTQRRNRYIRILTMLNRISGCP